MFMYKLRTYASVILYILTCCYSFWFGMSGIIGYHGLATTMYTMITIFVVAFLCTGVYITSKKPQATPRNFPSPAADGDILDLARAIHEAKRERDA